MSPTPSDARAGDGRLRLYRDPESGVLLGVCAGLADYLGVRVNFVRLLAVIGLFLFTLPTVMAYLLAGLILERRPAGLYRDPEDARFWRRARTEPRGALADLDRRLTDLDQRLRAAEAYVTSTAFKLRREFDDLRG
jgi:phage shock protein C